MAGKTRQAGGDYLRGIFEKVLGSGVWWIRYVDALGRYRREKAGTWGTADKLLARRRTEALDDKKLPELRKRTILFSELADDAIKYIEGRYARPADDVARMKLLKDRLPNRAADSLTVGEIHSLLEALGAERKWSSSSRNHHHNLLSLAYRLGILHKKAKESPLRGLRRKTENNGRVRFLTGKEEEILRLTIRSRPERAKHEAELDLALHTGLRRGSMYLGLTWENIDLKARVTLMPRTKNGEQVVVPLDSAAMRALTIFRSRGDGTGRVVRNAAGETLNVNAHWFIPAVRKAGIKDFHWHDCRHTYASRLRQAGVPLGNIAELLGHKGLAMSPKVCTSQHFQPA
jgi:integrase